MHRIIATTLGLLFLSTANAQQPPQAGIPDKVKADIIKRHPKAMDFQASHETHFHQHLLEVSFKEEGDDAPILELFTESGHLFTNEVPMDGGLGEAQSVVKNVLEKNFPGYAVKKAELIVNPNGVGEEYEIYLVAGGVNWKVSVTDKGSIEGKDHY